MKHCFHLGLRVSSLFLFMRIKCLNIVWYEFSCKVLCCTKGIGGGRQNYTPSCIAAVLGNSPADIFEKTVWVWAAFERARKVDIWP